MNAKNEAQMEDRPLHRVLLCFAGIVIRVFDIIPTAIGRCITRCCTVSSGQATVWSRKIVCLVFLYTSYFTFSQLYREEPEVIFNPDPTVLPEDLKQSIPNLPLLYWTKMRQPKSINQSCAWLPGVVNLQYNNLYWQTLRTSNGTFQLFGAYLDDRRNNRLGPIVRILGMIDRIRPTVATYCQFWYDSRKQPRIVRAFRYLYIWDSSQRGKDWALQPYLIDCLLPRSLKHVVPDSVSLTESPCVNATTNLRVIYDKPAEKKDFAVCVKGLDFLHEDRSTRLVEWIELLDILGADKIFFYKLQVHPNISKVLNYYEKEGRVHVAPLSLAGGQPNDPSFLHAYLQRNDTLVRQNEAIPYNDCFYRHMYEYRYIVVLDVDEVIVPTIAWTWRQLVSHAQAKNYSKDPGAFCANQVFYFPDYLLWDSPNYTHMLQHVRRAKKFSRSRQDVKCFLNTERVLLVHNNRPLMCLWTCGAYPLPTSEARLHHYRCPEKPNNCYDRNNTMVDTTIWRFKAPLFARVTNVLTRLGYF